MLLQETVIVAACDGDGVGVGVGVAVGADVGGGNCEGVAVGVEVGVGAKVALGEYDPAPIFIIKMVSESSIAK